MAQIQNKHILRCIPLLANILGDKYGIKVHISGENAKTDGNTIYLPNLPQNCSEEFLGLLRGYVDHEAAHIRYTDFDMLSEYNLTSFQKYVWNCIEDYRIEQKMAEHFEGCRTNFIWLIKHIFLAEKGLKNLSLENAIASWILFIIRSWDVPELLKQVKSLEKQINAKCPQLLTELGIILLKVQKCTSANDALNQALEITNCIEKYIKQTEKENKNGRTIIEQHQQNDSKGSDSNLQEETESQSLFEESSTEEDEQNRKNEGNSISKTAKRSRGLGESEEQNHICSSLRSLLAGSHLPDTIGEKAQMLIEKNKSKNIEPSIRMAMVGKRKIGQLSEQARTEALKISVGLKARLQGLLQAQDLVRHLPSSHGKINRNKLHALAVKDKRVFLQQSKREATNTAIHILLDASGSMRSKMEMANQACFALASALSSTKGINVGVTAFPGAKDNGIPPLLGEHVYVSPILMHGEKMMNNFSVQAGGGTPLTETLWYVLPQILKQKENRKIILLITDGEPDCKESSLHAIETIHNFGVEIYQIYIGNLNLPSCNLNSSNGILPNKSIAIKNINELPQTMFGLLQNTLVHKT